MKFVFIIYSCKKNLDIKSNLLYYMLRDKLLDTKLYIIYGDNELTTEYEIIEDKYLILKCGDFYENLSQKTVTLFNVIEKIHPDCTGIIKCDDDILPNINQINIMLRNITNNNNIHYLGNVNDNVCDYYNDSTCSKITSEKYKKPLFVRKCKYTTGPMYYLSMHSICLFNKEIEILNEIKEDPINYMYEDNMVGYILNSINIFPEHYKTYFDDFYSYLFGSIQNVDNKIRNLYVLLHGGLGNQIFQVSAGIEMANNNKMHLILVYDYNSVTHNNCIDEYLSTIFNSYNSISIDNVEFSKVNVYKEDRCYDYLDNIIQNNEVDYYLHGYFQNKNYLKHHKESIINIFRSYKKIDNFYEYPLLINSYFIHIRRGDYLNNKMYHFDMNDYIKKGIDYINNKDINPHFYILSDDIDYCKNSDLFDNIQKTFIENMNALDSLFFMSFCKKGGICCNSTFSGWATVLNDNPDKTIIMPNQWINIDYPYEIPFEFTCCM